MRLTRLVNRVHAALADRFQDFEMGKRRHDGLERRRFESWPRRKRRACRGGVIGGDTG